MVGISVMSAAQWRQAVPTAGLNYRLTVTRETTRGLHRFYFKFIKWRGRGADVKNTLFSNKIMQLY